MDNEAEAARWGTWEEFVLGGAVLRHGSNSWDSVASEVQTRTTAFPHLFTPEECKAKYEGLLGRYGGHEALFEELRKLRVKELRREIEKLECSIGSLQMKLETLKAVKQDGDLDCDTCLLASLSPSENIEGGESTGKERCRDGSSAGSFTECVLSRDSLLVCQIPAIEGRESEDDGGRVKLELSEDVKGKTQTLKKRRGKRRRKVCTETRDGGTGESEILSSASTLDAKMIDELVVDHDKNSKVPNRCMESAGEKFDWFPRILDCIMEHKDAGIFCRWLESQRKCRYKKLIRRHMDLEMIKRCADEKSYTTSLEIKRDLLLLLNNALVYYQKNSPEYNSAATLRKLVTEKFREFMGNGQGSALLLKNLISNPSKPRSSRQRKHEANVKADEEELPMGSIDKSGKDASLKRKKSDEEFSFIKEKDGEAVPFIKKKSVEDFSFTKKKDEAAPFIKKVSDVAFPLTEKKEKVCFIKKKIDAVSFIKKTIEDVSLKKKDSVQGVAKSSLPAKRLGSRVGKKDDERGGKRLKSSAGKCRKR